jgi:hypothetical protein
VIVKKQDVACFDAGALDPTLERGRADFVVIAEGLAPVNDPVTLSADMSDRLERHFAFGRTKQLGLDAGGRCDDAPTALEITAERRCRLLRDDFVVEAVSADRMPRRNDLPRQQRMLLDLPPEQEERSVDSGLRQDVQNRFRIGGIRAVVERQRDGVG